MYKHTQFGWLIAIALGVALFALLPSIEIIPLQFGVSLSALMLFICVSFCALRVEVSDALKVRFGVGLIRRTIAFTELESAAIVRNSWWMGWGIHYYGSGWLWNVWGLDAIELKLKNGKRFRIGTDAPEKLAAALQSKGVKRA
ncbi:MAG: hypothetical protein Q7S65_04880 [Nanoarchaeota archaeon]|nr:hypothetical protein [Nanoarchaeota archaeon]